MHTPLDPQLHKVRSRFPHIHLPISGRRLGIVALITLAVVVIIAIAGGIMSYRLIFHDLPNPDSLRGYGVVSLSSHIYDRNGKLLYEIYRDQNRTAVKLADLPTYLPQATVAIEDKDFYHHGGVSLFSGVLRAFWETYIARRGLQGGSTITQQLVKKALLTDERTWTRKVKEIILAVQVEKKFNKNQILEMYLNQVPYGGSAYGVEAASKMYFDKPAKNLTLAEAAMLAGLPQAPSRYSPYTNPDLTKSRRDEVLLKMYEQKYITKVEYEKALAAPIEIKPLKTAIKAPHFVFYVKQKLEEEFGEDLVNAGGLNIYTTLDLSIQEEAEKIVKEELEKVRNLNVGNAAALVTRPVTGEILAMVGSADYFASPSGSFNVTTALRQPGSSIKPINYAIGIDRKLVTPATVFLDVATCFPGGPIKYCPKNYDGSFHGPTQLRFALGNSNNIAAVKMMYMNGVENFLASAPAFLIDSLGQDASKYGLSLTLGGGEVRMYEMAQAFSAFANRGKPKKVNPLLKVVDPRGKVLYEMKDPNFAPDVTKSLSMPNYLLMTGKRAITEETAYLISHILLDNNARTQAFGPSSLLNISKHPAVSVKTGTTDNLKDNWTIGYTPNFLTAVWVGNNDSTPMNQSLVSGVTGAAPIWNKIMTKLLENQPDLWPVKPERVVGRQVCPDGRMQGTNGEGQTDCPGRYEYFIQGTEGVQNAQIKKMQIWVSKDTGKMAKEGDPNTEQQEKTVLTDGLNSISCLDCAQ